MKDKEISENAKLAEMRARRAAAVQSLRRGDLVCVVPSRGVELKGLMIDSFPTPLYGRMYEVLVGGTVRRFEEERVSAWRG